MKYTIKINETGRSATPAKGASIVGLLEDEQLHKDAEKAKREDVELHFAHHTFDVVWSEKTNRQESVNGVNKFFGGMGEGSIFPTWQSAILRSLYDEYQTNDQLHEGDEFEVTYMGETAVFRCVSFHVVRV